MIPGVDRRDTTTGDCAALEVVHEASHFAPPLGQALAAAWRDAGATRCDFVHQVHFFMTGEAVRRAMTARGEPYTPYLYAPRLFTDSFREAASRTWPAYMDGKRTLEEAAGDLVRAMNAP